MIEIKFFASIRESLQSSSIQLDYDSSLTILALVEHLISVDDKYTILRSQQILYAVNHTLCASDTVLVDGDEVAFLPPVTGG